MIDLTIFEAARVCCGEFCGPAETGNLRILDITIDSRTAVQGSLFIPIAGARLDGHDFIDAALSRGAICTLSERPLDGERPHIRVDSCFEAMKALASYIRMKSGVKVVAVVGSVGKTGTKEMIASVLSQKFRTLKTEGNYNNEYGLPQTLFRLRSEDEVAVLELGISFFGEMSRLGRIARPDYAVFTNIGSMHLENLIDRDGVLRAKTELIAHMREGGKLFLNGADDKLRAYRPAIAAEYFGMLESYPIHPSNIERRAIDRTDFILNCHGAEASVSMHVSGRYMLENAMAAACVGYEMGLNIEQLREGLESYRPVGHRGRIIELRGSSLIDDCYNAGPDSMRAAITALCELPGRRLALLGDMLELGEGSRRLHYEIGEFVAGMGVDMLFTVGEEARAIARGAAERGKTEVYELNSAAAAEYIYALLEPGDALLIKASRGMHFEKIIDDLLAKDAEYRINT